MHCTYTTKPNALTILIFLKCNISTKYYITQNTYIPCRLGTECRDVKITQIYWFRFFFTIYRSLYFTFEKEPIGKVCKKLKSYIQYILHTWLHTYST